jgi:multiple sugar transport system permease protein
LSYLAIALLPLAWMVSVALQTEDQIRISIPVQWIPNPVTWENFQTGWAAQNWPRYYANTLFFALGSSIGLVISSTLAGYAFARLRFPGREALMLLNISLMLLPGQVTMIPRFIMWAKLDLVGTWWPVMIPFFLAGAPFYVFLMRQFLRGIPMELSDAARIDGCNEFGVFWRIIVPLVKPAIAVMVAGHITWAWNDLLLSLIYLKDEQHRQLILALQGFIEVRGQVGWGPLMAMSTAVALPVIVVYFFVQRYFVQTFTLSGLKG